MKILFAIDRLNCFGGAQRVIANLANEAIKRGHEVRIIITGNTTESVYNLDARISLYCYSFGKSRIAKFKAIRSKIKTYDPDIIIPFLTMVNIVIILTTLGMKIPILISERNDPEKSTKKEKIFSKLLYRLASGIVVQTMAIAETVKQYGVKKIFVIPNPIIGHQFRKKDYHLNGKCIAVGRLTAQKNYKTMIEGFKEFVKLYPKFKLDIYGDGEDKIQLQEFINKNNLSKSVFLKGTVKNIIELECEYDCFIMTSDFEGMPNALAEALSVGVPCIATDCDGGGAKYLIQTGYNGMLIKKNDATELVNALKKVIDERQFAKKLGENAILINETLSLKNIMDLWFLAIEDIV